MTSIRVANVDHVQAPAAQKRVLLRIPPLAWGLLALLLLTLFANATLSSYHLFVFNTCLLAAMGALALNLQMGTTGQVSIGNSAFLLVGAFVAAALARAGAPFLVAVGVAAVVAGLSGLLIGVPAVRLRGLYFALATMAAFFIVHYLALKYQSSTVGEAGFRMEPLFRGRLSQTHASWSWVLFGVLVAVIVLVSFTSRSKVGRALRMVRDHENAAPAFGIDVVKYKLLVFGIGFSVIGLQGALNAYYIGHVSVDTFTLLIAIQYIAMIVIGGMDSVAGAVIGAFIVTALPVLTTTFVEAQMGADAGTAGPPIALIIYGGLVILFATRLTGGVVGSVRNLSVWVSGRQRR